MSVIGVVMAAVLAASAQEKIQDAQKNGQLDCSAIINKSIEAVRDRGEFDNPRALLDPWTVPFVALDDNAEAVLQIEPKGAFTSSYERGHFVIKLVDREKLRANKDLGTLLKVVCNASLRLNFSDENEIKQVGGTACRISAYFKRPDNSTKRMPLRDILNTKSGRVDLEPATNRLERVEVTDTEAVYVRPADDLTAVIAVLRFVDAGVAYEFKTPPLDVCGATRAPPRAPPPVEPRVEVKDVPPPPPPPLVRRVEVKAVPLPPVKPPVEKTPDDAPELSADTLWTVSAGFGSVRTSSSKADSGGYAAGRIGFRSTDVDVLRTDFLLAAMQNPSNSSLRVSSYTAEGQILGIHVDKRALASFGAWSLTGGPLVGYQASSVDFFGMTAWFDDGKGLGGEVSFSLVGYLRREYSDSAPPDATANDGFHLGTASLTLYRRLPIASGHALLFEAKSSLSGTLTTYSKDDTQFGVTLRDTYDEFQTDYSAQALLGWEVGRFRAAARVATTGAVTHYVSKRVLLAGVEFGIRM